MSLAAGPPGRRLVGIEDKNVMKSTVSYILAFLYLGFCGQVQASAPYPRILVFLNSLKDAIESRPQSGVILDGGADWYPLSDSQIRGIMRCLSQQGVTISDVNLR